jgi:hypothetical protein
MLVCRVRELALKTALSLSFRKSTVNTRKISSLITLPKQSPLYYSQTYCTFQTLNKNSKSWQQLSTQKMATVNNDKNTNIVWVDLEMSGLDLSKEVILEMACIVTDKYLNVLVEVRRSD